MSADTLVLYKSSKEKRQLQTVSFSLLLIFPILMYIILANAWTVLLEKMETNPGLFISIHLLVVFQVLLLILILYYRYQFLKRERIILDSEGIRYQSNLPKFIQAFVPFNYRDWSAKWSEVTATYLKNAPLLVRDSSGLVFILAWAIKNS